MSLFSKFKDVFFETEEIEEVTKNVKVKKPEKEEKPIARQVRKEEIEKTLPRIDANPIYKEPLPSRQQTRDTSNIYTPEDTMPLPVYREREPQRRIEPRTQEVKSEPRVEPRNKPRTEPRLESRRPDNSYNQRYLEDTISSRPREEKKRSTFMQFDESSFDGTFDDDPRVKKTTEKPRMKNVKEYEKKRKVEKRTDYGSYEKVEKYETKEKRKFTPSPIISPVFGVLNEDYTPNDVKNRHEVEAEINIENVRRKAYGELENLEKTIEKPTKVFYEEIEKFTTNEGIETITKVTEEVDILENTNSYEFKSQRSTNLLDELEQNLEQRDSVKTIDDFLDDTSELRIDIENDFAFTEEINVSSSSVYDAYDEEKEESKVSENTETLENDIFDLIDSIYESKED